MIEKLKILNNGQTKYITAIQPNEDLTKNGWLYSELEVLFPRTCDKFWGTDKKPTGTKIDDILNHDVFIA